MGCFLEPSYRWSIGGPLDQSIGIAARAGAWNDKADELQNASNKIRQYDLMLNWWLSPNAVLKSTMKTKILILAAKEVLVGTLE